MSDLADWTSSVVIQSGTVTITGVTSVSVSGTVGVTLSGNPQVQISNVPSVTISSGTVSIGNVATMNITQAQGVAVRGPNLLPSPMAGPLTAGWSNGRAFNCTLAFNADGTLTATLNNQPSNAFFDSITFSGAYAMPPCLPGQAFYFEAAFKSLDHANTVKLHLAFMDAQGNELGGTDSSAVLLTVGTWTTVSIASVTAIPGAYYILPRLEPEVTGTNNGDRIVVDHVLVANVGAIPINAQQRSLPVSPDIANQPPLAVNWPAQGNNTAQWLIAPAAGVSIKIFDIITTFISVAGAAAYRVGHNSVLPVAQPGAAQLLFTSGNTGAFQYDFHGAPLPVGEGIYIWNESGANLGSWHTLNYSL